MAVFIIVVGFFAVVFLVFGLQQLIGVTLQKQKFSKLLAEVSGIFTNFQYAADINRSLGLSWSANYDRLVEQVYNPKNLEIAQKTVINMWLRAE